MSAGKKSAADILASFRNKIDRQIAGEPDPDAQPEPEDGQTFFLTTSSAVRRRKDVEDAVKARKDLEANGRGRKRMAHELEDLPTRPPTALELLCQNLPPDPEPKPTRRAPKPKAERREEKEAPPEATTKSSTKPRRKAKIKNVPGALQYKYLKELLEKATGPIKEGFVDKDATAWLAFERAEDATALYNDFNGGEISGESIEVELLSDSEPLGDSGDERGNEVQPLTKAEPEAAPEEKAEKKGTAFELEAELKATAEKLEVSLNDDAFEVGEGLRKAFQRLEALLSEPKPSPIRRRSRRLDSESSASLGGFRDRRTLFKQMYVKDEGGAADGEPPVRGVVSVPAHPGIVRAGAARRTRDLNTVLDKQPIPRSPRLDRAATMGRSTRSLESQQSSGNLRPPPPLPYAPQPPST